MSIETDESLWPEGAHWYIKRRENNDGHAPFFAATLDSHPDHKDGKDISGKYYIVYDIYWEVIPRPKAQWPQVGVECEYNYYDTNWQKCKILSKHDGFYWAICDKKPFTIETGDCFKFRPISTLRDDAIATIATAIYNSCSTSYTAAEKAANDALNILMAKYELKEKTK